MPDPFRPKGMLRNYGASGSSKSLVLMEAAI